MGPSDGSQSTEDVLTPERFDAVRQELTAARAEAIQTVERQLAAAKGRIQFAQGERSTTADLHSRLGLAEQTGEVQEMHTRLGLLVNVYAEMEKANQILADVHQQNLEFFNGIPELTQDQAINVSGAYQAAHEDLRYIEARARLDVAMLRYHWFRQRLALDLLLRVHFNERALEAAGEMDATQAHKARELQSQMAQNKDLMVLVGKLASDVQEAQALMDWAVSSVHDFDVLPQEVKSVRLADRDWAVLNGKLNVLMNLAQRVADMPALAQHFPIEGSEIPSEPPFGTET
jgi:hypothetical protein